MSFGLNINLSTTTNQNIFKQIISEADELSNVLHNSSEENINQRIANIKSLIDQFKVEEGSQEERECVKLIQKNLVHISDPEDRICSICSEQWSEEHRPITLKCKHVFCKTCIDRTELTKCPICRANKEQEVKPLEREAALRRAYIIPEEPTPQAPALEVLMPEMAALEIPEPERVDRNLLYTPFGCSFVMGTMFLCITGGILGEASSHASDYSVDPTPAFIAFMSAGCTGLACIAAYSIRECIRSYRRQ